MAENNAGAEERPPTADERLAPMPMKLIAACLRRVVPYALYSDDAHILYTLAKLGDGCGELSFADFCTLISMPGGADSEQLGAFYREMQGKLEAAEVQLRDRSDELARERSKHAEELRAKDARIAELNSALQLARTQGTGG